MENSRLLEQYIQNIIIRDNKETRVDLYKFGFSIEKFSAWNSPEIVAIMIAVNDWLMQVGKPYLAYAYTNITLLDP